MICQHCAAFLERADLTICPSCQKSIAGASAQLAPTQVAATPAKTASTLTAPKALHYVKAPALTQLAIDASLTRKAALYTLPDQTYHVVRAEGKAVAIWCGGEQVAWISRSGCTQVAPLREDLSLPIPALLEPYAPGDLRRFRRKVLVPMPLAVIEYDSPDYRLLYQWLGEAAQYRPNLYGYVRDAQSIGSRSESRSETQQRLFFNSLTEGTAETINLYQIDVEDLSGARHPVRIQNRARYIPQRGDFVVLWTDGYAGATTLMQGLRRDPTNPAVGAVLMPYRPEQIRDRILTRFILE